MAVALNLTVNALHVMPHQFVSFRIKFALNNG